MWYSCSLLSDGMLLLPSPICSSIELKEYNMIRLLKFLFTGDWHLHEWKIIKTDKCHNDYYGNWTRHYCQCTHCGTIKKFD